MIRSRQGNLLVGLLGVALAGYATFSFGYLVSDEGLKLVSGSYEGVVSLLLFGLGVWCLLGAVRQWRNPASDHDGGNLITYRLARWNLIAIAVSAAVALISHFAQAATVFWAAYYVLLLSFAAVFAILIAHWIRVRS